MKKREAELEAEVDRWLKAAEAADAEEDKLLRQTSAAMRCPIGWPTSRSGWRRSARPRPSWRRKPKPPPRRRRGAGTRRRRSASRKAARRTARRRRRRDGSPTARRSATSPIRESRILKTKDGYIQGYNAQAAVDAEAQIIVAHGLTHEHERPGPTRAAHRWDRRQSRPQAQGSLSRCRLLQRGEPCGLGRARYQRLHRNRTRQASRRQANERSPGR